MNNSTHTRESLSVSATNLTKKYGKKKEVTAVDGVSFEVSKGEVFGLIGPDGAGKSSIFRMLTTLLLPDGGTATVEGYDIVNDYKNIRGIVGYMPGKFSLYQDLSVEENLNFFAHVFQTTIDENYYLIKDIYDQLLPFKTRRAGKLSGGMKQKLALCCALIHKPDVLFLDEPTTGIDPVSRKELWEMLKRLKTQGITIIVATPYMDEAALCDRIALIQNGKILSIDTPENISAAYPDRLFSVRSASRSALIKTLSQNQEFISCYAFGEYVHVALDAHREQGKELISAYLEINGLHGCEIELIKAGVEDCFIKLMQQP